MFYKLFLILLIGWISLFPVPIQMKYHLIIKVIFLSIFLFLFIKKKILINQKCLPLLIFIFFLLGSIVLAKNKILALKTYADIAVPLFTLYFIIPTILSYRNLSILPKIICFFSLIVAIWGILDILLGKNILYESFMDNPYYNRYLAKTIIKRPISTQFHPVALGTYLLICFPFGFILAKQKNLFWRIFGYISLLTNIFVLILTFSRGAFIGLVVFIIFYLFLKHRTKMMAMFIILSVIFIVVCSVIEPHNTFDRFGLRGLFYGKGYTSLFSSYRLARFKMILNIIKEHPFLGIGLNHIRLRFFDYYPIKEKVFYEWRIADNMYLTILGEAGIIGFIGFFIFIFFLSKSGIQNFFTLEDERKKEILLVGLSVFLAFLFNMFGYDLFYDWYPQLYLFCFLCGLINI